MSWIQYDPRLTRRSVSLPPPHPRKEGEAVSNTLISTLYKNPPHVVIPYDCDKRPEEKFQTSQLTPPKIAPTCMAADYKAPQLVITACVMPVRKR